MEAARLLSVGVSSISKWIDEGRLPAGRTPGGHRRIARRDFIEFIHKQGLKIPPELQISVPKMLIMHHDLLFGKWLAEEIGDRFPHSEIYLAHTVYTAGEMVGFVGPEIIILDTSMPGMDSLEICRRIRSNARTCLAAIIAVTDSEDPPLRDQLLGLGVLKYLIKPFHLEAVMTPIQKALANLGLVGEGQPGHTSR